MVSQPLQLHTTICLTKAPVFGVSWRRARGWQLSGNDSRGGLGLLTILNAICVICFMVVPLFFPLFPFFFFFFGDMDVTMEMNEEAALKSHQWTGGQVVKWPRVFASTQNGRREGRVRLGQFE